MPAFRSGLHIGTGYLRKYWSAAQQMVLRIACSPRRAKVKKNLGHHSSSCEVSVSHTMNLNLKMTQTLYIFLLDFISIWKHFTVYPLRTGHCACTHTLPQHVPKRLCLHYVRVCPRAETFQRSTFVIHCTDQHSWFHAVYVPERAHILNFGQRWCLPMHRNLKVKFRLKFIVWKKIFPPEAGI